MEQENILDERTMATLQQCSVSTKTFAQKFFPERFSLPFAPAIHDKIFELIDGQANKIAIAAPRGFGKTSIVALALLARHILFRRTSFICYINKTFSAATLQTENLKRELLRNELVRKLKPFFGDIYCESDKDYEESFSVRSWVAFNTMVWPCGSGQNIRGYLYKNDRPGLIVLDDIEDSLNIASKDYRDKTYGWLYSDVMKAVPQGGLKGLTYKIVYIDTLKHEDSILQKLLDSPDWTSIRLEACDDDFNPTAPEFLSKDKILTEWEDYCNAGQSDVFFREMRNIPISTKDAAFKDDMFRYYNLGVEDNIVEGRDIQFYDNELSSMPDVENIVIVDPAKTAKMESADSAIVGIAFDRLSSRIFIRDIDCGKMLPDDLYFRAFDMAKKIGARAVGWEVSGLEEFIKQPVKNYMHSIGMFFELVWLRARGGQGEEKGKALRVRSLVPYYRQGQIYHNRQCVNMHVLESQLKMFPRSKRWDVMDATAYLTEMLELGERYFSPQIDPDQDEDEYAELTYDAPIANWRLI